MRRYLYVFLLLVLGVTLGFSGTANAVINVRVQPSGPDNPSAYVITGEDRTYFGNVGGGVGPYEAKWEFSNGGDTAFAAIGDPRYIAINHIFSGSGLNWAKLTVRDTSDSTQDFATIQVQVLPAASDTLNRQKNSAIDKGLRYLYLQEQFDASGSYWGGYNIVAQTSMALIAFENHRHNLEAPDDDIYKKSVQEGLRWLFNHAYEVPLSNQACIGDPEANDGDTDHDGYGIAFYCDSEGYEVPIAMLAIVNSCSMAMAQTLIASSTSSPSFVNGMNYWDIIVDVKDFLAYAQTDSAGTTFSQWCDSSGGGGGGGPQGVGAGVGLGGNGYYSVDQQAGGSSQFDFYAELSASSYISDYYDVYPVDFQYWGYPPTLTFYTHLYDPTDCGNLRFKVDYGDGTPPEVSGPEWCDTASYGYKYFYDHTYPTSGTYTASAAYGYYSPGLGDVEQWFPIHDFEVTIPGTIDCGNFQFKFAYGDGAEYTGTSYCEATYAEVSALHAYANYGTYTTTASYSNDGGETWTEICSIVVPYSQEECDPNGDGWRYYRNYGDSDNSVTQWPTLALEEARNSWGININPAVIDRLKLWLAYSQGPTTGGFAYDYPGSWENFAKTGAGLAMLKYAGFGPSDTNVQNALAFLDSHWGVPDPTNQDGNLGYDYAMYAFYKGMKYLGLNLLGTRYWEDEYIAYLVSSQNGIGYWTNLDDTWLPMPTPMTSAAAIAMLAPAVAGLPPVAEAGGPYGPVNANQLVMLDGSGSFHQDPTKNLVSYLWDFDVTDGLWWENGPTPGVGEGAVGITANTTFPDLGSDYTPTVTLRVVDDNVPAKWDEDTTQVSVTSGNVPPVALTNGPWAGLPGDTIIFDGTTSYDPNGCTTPGNPSCLGDSIVSYEWDLDGDGLYNEGNGDDGTPVVAGDYSKVQKVFPMPVSSTITLRVTDEFGLVGLSQTQVNVVSIAIVYAQKYTECFRVQLNRFESRMGIVVTFKNEGNSPAQKVVVTLTQVPTNLTILKGTSSLGDLDAGEEEYTECNSTTKIADIELKLDRRIVPTGQWRWTAEFDFNGQHYIINNIPPLGP